jgi:hypothetical protein
MRILSARARDVRHDRLAGRVAATIILHIETADGEEIACIRTSAAVAAAGGAPLKDRLVASAKLILAMGDRRHLPSDALARRTAA